MSMKRIRIISALLLCVSLLSAAACCSVNRRVRGYETDKLHVVCTVYTVYDWASELLGEEAEIKLLMTPGTDVHGYEPSSDDMRVLEDSDILIYSGAGLETWLPDVLSALDNKDIVQIDCSTNVNLLTVEETVTEFGGYHTGHEDHTGHEGHQHGDGIHDPHIWMSPDNAITEVKYMYENLLTYCENHENCQNVADKLQQNYSSYIEELEQLASDYEAVLGNLNGTRMVVSYEAFGYMCHEYGIEQIAIDGLNGGESDARLLAEVIDYIKNNGIKYIFYEDLINPETAEVISGETGCELVALRALGSMSEDDVKSGMNYIKSMQNNLEALRVLG